MLTYDLILDQNPWWYTPDYVPPESLWPHRTVFDLIKSDLHKEPALMVTGLRRTGKSTIARQLIGHLLKQG